MDASENLTVIANRVRSNYKMVAVYRAVTVLKEAGEPEIAGRLAQQALMLPAPRAVRKVKQLILSAGLETVLRTEEARTDSDVADPMMVGA